ncbi:MAG: hypothetical protein A3F91_11205 [Flavobacteria bacterium RIFCSPLOWO2_12_FULL_35_11]|nr:MAG: hypothetical protein A3F91_11205 [Flavobacteria bacterium RIFCSPLOWO2_12_FULL_35_11]
MRGFWKKPACAEFILVWQSFEHIASQTRNAGISTSIANANFKFNYYLFSFSIDEKETKNLVY